MTTFQEILDALYGDQVLQLTEDAVVGHPLAQIVAENLIAAQNREANWPAAALADPPEFPFEFDRHTYTADTDRAWRERNERSTILPGMRSLTESWRTWPRAT